MKPLVRTAEGYRIANNASRHFLGARIQGCYKETRELETDLYFQRRQLEFILQPGHFQELEEHRVSLTNHVYQKSKATQIRKFNSLLERNRKSSSKPVPRNWVVNLSSKSLTQPQQSVLAKGLNFAVAPKKIPTPKIVASVEGTLPTTYQQLF